jgi:glycosyltransferase involved in cell wall biosynthesis
VSGTSQNSSRRLSCHPLHKNLARLVSAFAQLRSEDNLKLVIVGGGDIRHQERTLTRARLLNTADRVVLLNSLTDGQLSALYRGCRVFVYPSLYEGFGLPVLEAMTHAAAVACSRASSIPEVGGDAVEYFDPMSVDDIRRKLQLLLDNRDFTQSLAARGLERSGQFSWERTARSIHERATALVGAVGHKH